MIHVFIGNITVLNLKNYLYFCYLTGKTCWLEIKKITIYFITQINFDFTHVFRIFKVNIDCGWNGS